MGEPTPYQKLAANLAYLRKNGASPDDIRAEIGRFKTAMDAKTREERQLSPAEHLAGMGSELASGATFGLFDEAMGLIGGQGAKDEQRFLQKQFREENPVGSVVLEGMGSLALPGTFLKPAARTASAGAKIARTLGEGAIQGGLAGMGNAEGSLPERAGATLKGATMGSATAGAIGGLTKAASGTVGNVLEHVGLTHPSQQRTMERLADDTPDADLAQARQRLADLTGRKLGHEAMVVDVLPQGEGALRQAATSNREVRKTVDKELRQRMNRLSNEADARFNEYTGTNLTSGERTLANLNNEAAQRARPHYQAAADEVPVGPNERRLTGAERESLTAQGVPADKLPPTDAIDEALSQPFVQQRIDQLRNIPRSSFRNMADDDFRMLDQVYKDIGQEIRSLPREKWALKQDLVQQRAVLADGITSRSPSYRKALDEFADPMARKDAYEMGAQRTPSDMIPVEMADLSGPEQAMYREGKAGLLRRDVPNIDVGEFARFQDVLAPIATREKAQVFRATFGDKAYKEYVTDLMEMAGLQRMKAGAGESTTIDKLMEQLHADPEAIVGMVAQVLRGNPMAAVAQFSPTNAIGRTIDRLRQNKTAAQRADFLMQRGGDKVQAALDLIEKLRAEGKLPRPRDWRNVNARAALSREVGSFGGRP